MRNLSLNPKSVLNYLKSSSNLLNAIQFYFGVWKKRSKNSTEFVVFLTGVHFEGKTIEENIDYIKQCADVCKSHQIKFIVIRNNMTNPDLFREITDFGNIILVPDYTVINVGKRNILCIGGGITNNRSWKKNNTKRKSVVYYENEMPYMDENAINEICENKDLHIDMLVTHMSPTYIGDDINNFVGKWSLKDETLFDDVFRSRRIFDDIIFRLTKSNKRPSVWVYYETNQTVDKIRLCGTFYISDNFINNDIKDYFKYITQIPTAKKHLNIKEVLEEEEYASVDRRHARIFERHPNEFRPHFDIDEMLGRVAPVLEVESVDEGEPDMPEGEAIEETNPAAENITNYIPDHIARLNGAMNHVEAPVWYEPQRPNDMYEFTNLYQFNDVSAENTANNTVYAVANNDMTLI